MNHPSAVALVLAGLVGLALGFPRTSEAQSWSATFGVSGGYETDEACLNPGGLNTVRLGADFGAIAVSGSYNDGAWPWPEPPTGNLRFGAQTFQPAFFIEHGSAFQVTAELHPLELFGSEGRVGERVWVTPFVGAGVHIARDGDPDPGVDLGAPVFGVSAQTSALVTYGVAVDVSLGRQVRGLALRLEARGNAIFAGDFDLRAPQGQTDLTLDSRTLNYGELSIGFSWRPGG